MSSAKLTAKMMAAIVHAGKSVGEGGHRWRCEVKDASLLVFGRKTAEKGGAKLMTHFMAAMIFGGTEKQGRHENAKAWQPSFTLGKPRGENHGSHRWGQKPGRANDPTPAPPAGTPPPPSRAKRASGAPARARGALRGGAPHQKLQSTYIYMCVNAVRMNNSRIHLHN